MTEKQTQKVVLLENVRFSYLYAFRPITGTNDKGQATVNYCGHAIMDPGHAGIEIVKAAQREVAAAAWGDQAINVLTALAGQDRLCLHDGNISKAGQEAYANKFFVSANSKNQPRVCVTRNGANVDILEADPCAPYSGAWGNMLIAVYAQLGVGKSALHGKRVNAQLMGVQFLRHDTRFGGGRIAKLDEFKIAPAEADGAVPMAPATAGAAGSLV